MRQRNALLLSLSPLRMHLSLYVGLCRAHVSAAASIRPSRSRLITLFEEVRLMLTGSLRPAAALHRIPNGLGAEGLVIEENQSNSSACGRDISPITMSDSASVSFPANLVVLLLRARFNIPDLGPIESTNGQLKLVTYSRLPPAIGNL